MIQHPPAPRYFARNPTEQNLPMVLSSADPVAAPFIVFFDTVDAFVSFTDHGELIMMRRVAAQVRYRRKTPPFREGLENQQTVTTKEQKKKHIYTDKS